MHGVRCFRAASLQLRASRIRTGNQVHRALTAPGSIDNGHIRFYSATTRSSLPVTFTKPSSSPTFTSIPTCPDPSCECATTPKLPKPIDYEANIRESAPGYVEHVVISTGRSDWRSRIEDEGKQDGETVQPEAPTPKERFKGFVKSFSIQSWRRGGDDAREVGLARGLKAGLGRHGAYFDPMRPMLVTNASFSPPTRKRGSDDVPEAAAFLFPAFQYVTGIPDTPSGHEAFLQAFLASGAQASAGSSPWQTTPVTVPTILICSHGTRDVRCGVLGPLLQAEFRRQLARVGITSNDGPANNDRGGRRDARGAPEPSASWTSANVGTVSHIGGHKWAGNVIVYVPPDPQNEKSSGLEGKGVWYGRVEPRHVEGIVRETVLGGRVIEELCRGVRG